MSNRGKERRDKVPSFPHYRNRDDFDPDIVSSFLHAKAKKKEVEPKKLVKPRLIETEILYSKLRLIDSLVLIFQF
jgi:hypothetical protein